jgi:hypothetical protein
MPASGNRRTALLSFACGAAILFAQIYNLIVQP